MATVGDIYSWLEEVKDPEIPVLSLVDLGVITRVETEGASVRVEMTPTFVGCPALDFMKAEVETVLKKRGFQNVEVEVNYKTPWSSDMISERGKTALKKFGIAPPPASSKLFTELEILETPACPRCGQSNTELRSPFGPTLCRAIYYCLNCRESFEQFKPL